MGFVIYNSVEDVKSFQKYTESIAEHFGSDLMAEKYLDGLINWDGSEVDEGGYDYDPLHAQRSY